MPLALNDPLDINKKGDLSVPFFTSEHSICCERFMVQTEGLYPQRQTLC